MAPLARLLAYWLLAIKRLKRRKTKLKRYSTTYEQAIYCKYRGGNKQGTQKEKKKKEGKIENEKYKRECNIAKY